MAVMSGGISTVSPRKRYAQVIVGITAFVRVCVPSNGHQDCHLFVDRYFRQIPATKVGIK